MIIPIALPLADVFSDHVLAVSLLTGNGVLPGMNSHNMLRSLEC